MKNLTVRYSITHFTHWAAATGASAFATTYLLGRGVPAGVVGLLLALSGLCSCLTQPLLASYADRSRKFILTRMLVTLCAVSSLCFLVQMIPVLPLIPAAVLYVVGVWCNDASGPILNALSVACNAAGYPINYGAARGIGSAASAVASLVIGIIIARLGTAWMLFFLITFRLVCLVVYLGYPKLRKEAPAAAAEDSSCSIPEFFGRYRWFCGTLIGIAFLGMYLAMTENYMIAIMQALDGDSSNVGTALFISSAVGAPVIFFFSKVRAHIRDTNLLKIAAVSFLARAVLLYLVKDITAIYLIQLLHITSYAFLAPTQVYFARARVRSADMVKGQAFVTACYSLGCAAGNFIGGQLLGLGVRAILIAGIVMALAGTVILFGTVNRSDLPEEAPAN